MTDLQLPPSPEPNAETLPYWTAANEGRLLLKRCLGTGKTFYPPRTISPFTGLAETDWIEASGAGTVYSFSTLVRQSIPQCIAYIRLEEGPIILSNLIDCDPDSVYIGQPVRVTFVASASGQQIPMFTPNAKAVISAE
jgi:uncharacterized OB-fold protein